ncbi:MAG: fibronectin type III domain-containing protein, partial [Planctomycetota bacterium]
ADLSWTAGSGATSHDVYFGTTSPGAFQGNQAATTFDTGTMANDTIYYWRIDEVNAGGTTTGTVWSFTTADQEPPPSQYECDNWQTLHPEWIFCDDFEDGTAMVREGRYFEHDTDSGDFVITDAVGVDDSKGMRVIWQSSETGAGSFKLAFGRNPSSYMDKGIRNTEDFRDIYYRFYLKMQDGWQGNPRKLSRATVIAASDWSQAMVAHHWGSSGSYYLAVDPVSCVDASSQVICIGYNDVANFEWLGSQTGTTPIFDSNNDDLWHYIEVHVKLNDPGEANGIEECWIDGTLDARRDNLDFVTSYTDYAINAIFVENYWDGGSPQLQERYFDNFVVSTQPIGARAVVVATNPAPADDAADVSINTTLNWTPGDYADTHDVYLGTDVNAVSDANHSSAEFMGNVDVNTYDPCGLDYSTTYYWAIDEVNDTITWAGTVWSFTTEAMPLPGQASNPSPADSATNVDIDADLSWTAGSGSTSSDVYFGTTSPGTFQGNQTATTFDPGTMGNDTTYYWRIDEVNAGGTTTGNVWSFTTIVAPPGQATNPDPADTATDVSTDADLSWTAGTGSTSSDVYFGTTSPGTFQGNQTATTFDPGAMSNDTTYYWRIDEINAAGTTTGNVWSFTTIVAAPGQASNPSPASGATSVNVDADLSWTAGSGATSHDVYFGTTSPGTFQGNQTATTFEPGTMANDTTYYWRIDEISPGGTTTGVVWSFTTVVSTGDEIIAWWELDDASGSTATDSTVYAHDGTLNGPAWLDDVEQGWCLDFNSSRNDYVSIGDESFFDLTGDITVMAWINAGYLDWSNFSTVIAKGRDGN